MGTYTSNPFMTQPIYDPTHPFATPMLYRTHFLSHEVKLSFLEWLLIISSDWKLVRAQTSIWPVWSVQSICCLNREVYLHEIDQYQPHLHDDWKSFYCIGATMPCEMIIELAKLCGLHIINAWDNYSYSPWLSSK